MARREKIVTIEGPPGNRDSGKMFRIREMDAEKAEEWAERAFFAVGKAGLDVPIGFLAGPDEEGGDNSLARFAGIAMFVGQALLACSFEEAKPLMDEMMGCIKALPDKKHLDIEVTLNVATFIEEVTTIFTLRKEVIDLHLGFSVGDVLSKSIQDSATKAAADSLYAPTSPGPSPVPSPLVWQH